MRNKKQSQTRTPSKSPNLPPEYSGNFGPEFYRCLNSGAERKCRLLTPRLMAQRRAKTFLWHLELPWCLHFDHTHWWQNKSPKEDPKSHVPVEATLWEIFRRHPEVPHFRLLLFQEQSGADATNPGRPCPRNLLTLAAFCLRSWPKVPESIQELWKRFLIEEFKPQHGVNPGGVTLLNEFRKNQLILKKQAETDPEKRKALFHSVAATYIRHNVAGDAGDASGRGEIVLAIDPHAKIQDIRKRVEDTVKAWKDELKLKDTGKVHQDQWLDQIAKFEQDALQTNRKKMILGDQLSAQYRRVIKRWSWPF